MMRFQESHAGTISGCVWPQSTLVNWKTLPRTHKPRKKVPTPSTVVKLKVGSDPNNNPREETQVQSLGQEDPLEKGLVIYSSSLAWRILWTEEPGMNCSSWGRKESDMTEQLTLSLSMGNNIEVKSQSLDLYKLRFIAQMNHLGLLTCMAFSNLLFVYQFWL